MRFNINLASQPYEDAGRFYRRWLLALAMVTVLSLILVYAAVSSWRTSRAANSQVRQLQQTLAQLNADQKKDEAILNQPEHADVRLHAEFLNAAIRRKAFSWTQVFSEFEHIMPGGLHVLSVKPELTADNQLVVRMVVAGDSRERGLELMRRMEQSKSFRQTALSSERISSKPPDTIEFDIQALYIPPAAPPLVPNEPQTQASVAAPKGGR